MQSTGAQYDYILFFGTPSLIVLAQWSSQDQSQDALTLRVRPHRSLYSSKIDSVLLISLGFRHEFPAIQRNWKQARTSKLTYCIDLLYRNGTKMNTRFSPIQDLPRALAHGSTAEPDTVYPQWPMSFLTAYGTVPYNDRRLLVAPEGPLVITATQINTLIQFCVLDYRMENCSLALHIPEYGSEAMMEITRVGSSTIYVWSLALDDEVESVDAEALIQVPPAPH